MARQARVYSHGEFSGRLLEHDEGTYEFVYDSKYLEKKNARSVSLTLPLTHKPYTSKTMFSFFDGLIPEGWLLQLTTKNWKLDPRDRMGLLLEACGDCIGAVHITAEVEND